MKELIEFTQNIHESQLFGELLARILGETNQKSIYFIGSSPKYKLCKYTKKEADLKLKIRNYNGKFFTVYADSWHVQDKLNEYFNNFYTFLHENKRHYVPDFA